jgi:hypothetical protein
VLGHRASFIPMSRVESRLAAARLVLWEFNGQSTVFEHADHCSSNFRVESVHYAGDEQLYCCW